MDEVPIDAPPPESALAAEARTGEIRATASPARSPAATAPLIALAAWIVPGLGHLLLGRWVRALAFFVAVAGLVSLGYGMRGDVFPPHSADPFGTLGFLADAGSGCFYLLSRFFESAGPDISRAAGDYGTRVIAAAGIVNVLAVIDVYETAWRRRS